MKLLESLIRATPFLGGPPTTVPTRSSLIVDIAPSTAQPYVLPNLKGAAVDFGGLIVRTLVSNATSSGSMSLLSVNSGPSGLNLIHSHREVEAFYTLKGSVQVFHNEDQGREIRANDFALLAPGNNHGQCFLSQQPWPRMAGVSDFLSKQSVVPASSDSPLHYNLTDIDLTYRPNDLDFQLSLCMAPGGIDEFFSVAGAPYTSAAPFNPEDHSELDGRKVLDLMPKYNIVPAPNSPINMHWTNGTTEDGLDTWHVAGQRFPVDSSKPYFISSNRGPKYLDRASGQVVAQLASGNQTKDKLSVATIAMKPSDQPSGWLKFNVDQAFQVTEGQLSLRIDGEVVQLIFGDVAFIPMETGFRYWSTVGFTKFIVWSAGPALADCLLEKGERWEHAVWPA